MGDQDYSLAVLWLDNSNTEGLFTDAVAELRGRYPAAIHMRVQSGANISNGRNIAINHFLATDKQWALLVDADQTWNEDAVDRLFEVAFPGERSIVGGLCFSWGSEGFYPTIYQLNPQGDLDRIENFDVGGARRVDATGTGFLLVHRGVFEKIKARYPGSERPWFAETQSKTGMWRSEDVTFCRRAAEAGFKMWVHTGVNVGHVKKQVIDYRFYANWVEHHRLLVTGVPRSGTTYVQLLLAQLGIGIGHETVYTTVDPKPWGLRRGEVSWLAAPGLRDFHGTVAHLVRDPLAVLNSLMGIGFFHQPDAHVAWVEFISRQGIKVVPADPLGTVQRFIVEWNRRIEPYANRRIKIEEIGVEELGWLALAVDALPDRVALGRALAAVPRSVNSRTRANIPWEACTDEFRQLARDYGYAVD